MKSNVLLVLLTATVTLLAVNLMQGRIPPTAHAAFGNAEWQLACTAKGCWQSRPKALYRPANLLW